MADQLRARKVAREAINASEDEFDLAELITQLEAEMLEAARKMEFEKAARLRDRIAELKEDEAVAVGSEDYLSKPPKKTGPKGRRAQK